MLRLAIGTLFMVTLVWTNNLSANDSKINEHKARIINHIGERMALLENFKNCVNGASKKSDLAACRDANRKKMQEIKNKMQSMRKNKKQ